MGHPVGSMLALRRTILLQIGGMRASHSYD
jgi:hypothetical protein